MTDLAQFVEDADLTPEMRVPVLTSTGAARRLVEANRHAKKAAEELDRARQIESGRVEQPRVQRAEADVAEAEVEVEAAREAARQHLKDFVFEPVGSAFWRRLMAANPPTDQQKKNFAGQGRLRFDLDIFPIVAVAFCLTEPTVPDKERIAYRDWLVERKGQPPLPPTVVKLQELLPENVWQQLWGAALEVNEGDITAPSGLSGSDETSTSEPMSEPPAN